MFLDPIFFGPKFFRMFFLTNFFCNNLEFSQFAKLSQFDLSLAQLSPSLFVYFFYRLKLYLKKNFFNFLGSGPKSEGGQMVKHTQQVQPIDWQG